MPSNDTAMLQSIHCARSEFYMFLGRIYSNIADDEFYKMLSDMAAKLTTLVGFTDNEDIISGTKQVISFLDKRASLSGKDLSDFDLESSRCYTTMFCLTNSVPTDESIYTNPEHREKHDSFDKMRALFRKHGIEKSDKLAENDDFVSYEFIFMAKLAADCGEIIAKGNAEDCKNSLEEQYNFHLDHFDKWIYEFFGRILNFPIQEEKLYKPLAQLARGFVQEDKLTLKELLV